jgi:hypothetical protein
MLNNVYQSGFNVKKIKEAMGTGMKIGKMGVCVCEWVGGCTNVGGRGTK